MQIKIGAVDLMVIGIGVRAVFKKDVTSLVPPTEEVGNPFEKDSNNLYAIESKLIVGDHVMLDVKNVVQYIVEEQFEKMT